MNKLDVERYIKQFNNDFKQNLAENKFPFLVDLFTNYFNQEMSDPVGIEYYQNIDSLDKEISEKLDDEGKQQFEKWTDVQNDYLVNAVHQAFVYGFCAKNLLDTETRLNYVPNNIEDTALIERFDKIFNTSTSEHIKLNMPLLKHIYYLLEETIRIPCTKYNRLRDKKIKLSDKLSNTLNTYQNDCFENYRQISNEMASVEDFQLFCFGYLLAKELDRESKIKKE